MSLSILSTLLPASLAGVNYRPGRSGPYPVDTIVVHVTEGDAASVVSWFNDPAAQVSAHYLVRRDGKILQFVDEANTAYHAGRVDHPTAQLVLDRAPQNPNSFSIGVEHEGQSTQDLTDAQRAASVALLADICQRRGIPADRDHIIRHHEVYSLKVCPGIISVDALVADVAVASAARLPLSAPADYPRAVWSPLLNDWLVVVQYVDDANWSYATLRELSTMRGNRATTPLSQMPTTKPARGA